MVLSYLGRSWTIDSRIVFCNCDNCDAPCLSVVTLLCLLAFLVMFSLLNQPWWRWYNSYYDSYVLLCLLCRGWASPWSSPSSHGLGPVLSDLTFSSTFSSYVFVRINTRSRDRRAMSFTIFPFQEQLLNMKIVSHTLFLIDSHSQFLTPAAIWFLSLPSTPLPRKFWVFSRPKDWKPSEGSTQFCLRPFLLTTVDAESFKNQQLFAQIADIYIYWSMWTEGWGSSGPHAIRAHFWWGPWP